MPELVTYTELDLPNRRSGKVRDIYDCPLPDGRDGLLIVATDRISAFDIVLETGLPGKGEVLTQLSRFWFEHFSGSVAHHLVSTDVKAVPGLSARQRETLAGRVMLCRKTRVVPVECIARGYITGTGWKDYQRSGKVCGIELPVGLLNSDRLDEPLFTPSTKADVGDHDENISFEQGVALVGEHTMSWLRDTTLRLYVEAREYAGERGILLADTKFEFGMIPGEFHPILIDEIFTPDSSRFWPADRWNPGREQESFDKQFVRNYLEELVSAGEWNKTAPGPRVPDHVVEATMARYVEAYEQLTGSSFRFS